SDDLRWLRVAEPGEAWEFHPAPSYVQEVANQLGASRPVSLPDLDGRPDPVIWAIAASFRAGMRRGRPMHELEAGERLLALVAHVLPAYGDLAIRGGPGRLDPSRLSRVVDYIDAHLGDRIALDHLAAAA